MFCFQESQLFPVSSNKAIPTPNYVIKQLAPACVLNKLLVGYWLYSEVKNDNYGSSIFQLVIQQTR